MMHVVEMSRAFVANHGIWLASVAATAGLMLGVRWLLQARSMRGRALRVLSGPQMTEHGAGNGLRFAVVVVASVLTVFALTPNGPGTGALDIAANAPPPTAASQPGHGTIIVVASDAVEIVVSVPGGSTVEIRLREPDAAVRDVAPSLDQDQRHGTFSVSGSGVQYSLPADSE